MLSYGVDGYYFPHSYYPIGHPLLYRDLRIDVYCTVQIMLPKSSNPQF